MAGPGGRHSDAVLKEAFGLSDAQVASLKTLGEKRQASVEALHKQMAKIEETYRAGFKALLTPDQQKKLAELEAVRAAQALSQLGL